MRINRRQFLAELLAVGAVIALPVRLAQATPTQIDAAWQNLLEEPWLFDVDACKTITSSDTKQLEIRSEVFDVDLTSRCTVESLIDDITACCPLSGHMRILSWAELAKVQLSLEADESLKFVERRRLKRLAKALDNEEYGWEDWIRLEGSTGLQRFKEDVGDWLSSPIDGDDVEYLPRFAGAQGSALGFFESMPRKTLQALGVVIVDGEHPGSSYFAAELRKPVESANDCAARLGLPFRFRALS